MKNSLRQFQPHFSGSLLLLLAVSALAITCAPAEEEVSSTAYPLEVTVEFLEADYSVGDRIAVAVYDSLGKVGSSDYLLMTGMEYFNFVFDLQKLHAPTVYLLAFRDDNPNYQIDNNEPYTISTGIDLTSGSAVVTVTFDATNLW